MVLTIVVKCPKALSAEQRLNVELNLILSRNNNFY
jgi:hypothetical protein